MAPKFCNLILEALFTEDSHKLLLPISKFRYAAYEKFHLDLLQSFIKIKLKAHSQLPKKFVDKFCSPSFLRFQSSELTNLVAINMLATCFV